MDVADWLRSLGLEQYELAFRDNAIDGEVLPRVTRDDLKDIGVAQIGHRRKLLDAIAALGVPAPAPIPSAVDRPSPAVAAAPSGGERRQLTVMFCDLVGSTALSEKLDPEELRGLLDAYRTVCGEVIARYDGFVARYVGDGILIYFGWPTAHEEDAERAVRAALEIVHTVKRVSSTEDLSVRVGIATGPVVVGAVAGTGDRSELAVGSTPNLAARLQALAAAAQIVIAASSRRLIGNAFELTDLGQHDLKGIAEPVHAWRVERALLTESRFDANRGDSTLTPLVGRDEELDLLLRRWSQANDGEGQVVLLSGEAGIGKSRILSALRERLEAQGVQALRFQCSPYYVNSAFWPVIDNFERALKFTRDETEEVKLDKLEALIVMQYGRPLADVCFIASILSLPFEARYGAMPMTPQKHKDETLRTLVDLIEAAAVQQPSVMLFEDAHWADPTTLEVLDLLIDRVKTIPLLVVLTHRPEFQSRWSGQGHVGALNLSKLTRSQSVSMVSALTGGKVLPEALFEQILTRTDGVPLFVEELTKSILESGELKETGDHYEYAGSARAVTIPATLRDSLMARLDRFMPVKEIAQIGAAIGREFSYELIAAIAPMPQAQLDNALAQLTASGLAFRRGTPPDAIYTFKHALVQDAAYDSLLKSRRQELHGKIARVIEQRFPNIKASKPEVLAHQWTEAGDLARGAAAWQKAGDLFALSHAFMEAERAYQNAADALAGLSESMEKDIQELALRSMLADVLQTTRGYSAPSTVETFDRVRVLAERTGDRDKRCQHLFGAWAAASSAGDYKRASVLADQFYQLAIEDPARRGQAHMVQMTARYRIGDLRRAEDHFVQGQADFASPGFERRRGAIAQTYGNAAYVAWALGDDDAARGRIEHALLIAQRNESVYDLAFAQFMAAVYEILVNNLARAAELSNDSIRLSGEFGFPQFATAARISLGRAKAGLGSAAEGVKLIREGLAGMAGTSSRNFLTAYMTWLAEAYVLAGLPDEALDAAREALRINPQELCFRPETLRLRGEILLRGGKPGEAERDFLDALALAKQMSAGRFYDRATGNLRQLLRSRE